MRQEGEEGNRGGEERGVRRERGEGRGRVVEREGEAKGVGEERRLRREMGERWRRKELG